MKTIIEAGHYYQVNGPSILSIKGWEIGKSLVANYQNAELALFIDDYHQEQTFLEPEDAFLGPDCAAQTVNTLLNEAAHVFHENTLAKSAHQRMNELLEDGAVRLKNNILSVGGVRLGHLRRY